MKRFYLLLASLLALGTAMAEDFVPTEGTTYCIKSVRSNKYVEYSESNFNKFVQVSSIDNLLFAGFKFEEGDADGDKQKYYIWSYGLNGYVNNINNVRSDKGKNTQWYILTNGDAYVISKNAELSGWDAWNDEGRSTVTSYQGSDAGSQWTITEFEDFDGLYTSTRQIYVDRYTNCTAKAHETALLCPNPAKVEAVKSLVDATPETAAEKMSNLANLRLGLAASRILNVSANGLYTIKNPTNGNATAARGRLCEGVNRKGVHKETEASRSVWRIAQSDIDTVFTIQNYLTGDYIQPVTQDQQVSLSSNVTNYRVYFYGGDNGYVALGTNGGYTYLNFSNRNNNIFGWSTHWGSNPDGGTQMKIEAVDDAMLSAATEAEKTLALEESSPLDGSPILKDILGITEHCDNEGVESLNDYISGNVPDINVYAKIAGNVYRICGAEANANAPGKYFSFNSSMDKPWVEDYDAKNMNQLWQFVPSGNGFLIKNCNLAAVEGKNAYIPQVEAGGVNETVFAVETGAKIYWIEVTDANNKVVKLKYGNNVHDAINIETQGFLSRWGDGGSKLSIALVESVDIDLNDGGDGKSYATAYLPFAVSGVTGAKAYTASEPDNNTITLAEASAVAANTGIVLIGDATATSATLTIGEGTEPAAASALTGTTVAKTVDANSVLTLGKSDETVGFFAYTGTELRANSAYLEADNGAAALVFSFGNTDAIESVGAATVSGGKVYDLSGRRVSKAGKGIYIVNGKKVIK